MPFDRKKGTNEVIQKIQPSSPNIVHNLNTCMLQFIRRCSAEVQRAKSSSSLRRLCHDFKSDTISINGHNPDHVKGYVGRFKLMNSTDIVPLLCEHVNENLLYDSQWHFRSSDKYFEAERFIYCRVHNDRQWNLKPTVIMMLLYLMAKKKHREVIMRELKHTFSSIESNDTETVVVISRHNNTIEDKGIKAIDKQLLEDVIRDDAQQFEGGGLLMILGLTIALLLSYPLLHHVVTLK